MESDTNGDVDFSGVHFTAAESVSIDRHRCATRVWSPLSWSRGEGGGNAPLSSASNVFPLRSYLSWSLFAFSSPVLTPKFMAKMGMLPPAVNWKTKVARCGPGCSRCSTLKCSGHASRTQTSKTTYANNIVQLPRLRGKNPLVIFWNLGTFWNLFYKSIY
jgi:hypothetical protein